MAKADPELAARLLSDQSPGNLFRSVAGLFLRLHGVKNPIPREGTDGYCPICGVWWVVGHRCNQRTLAGIDGAHSRRPDEEDPPRIPYGLRLYDGLVRMQQDGAFD